MAGMKKGRFRYKAGGKLPKLGSGKRFAALKGKIARRGNVRNPAAVAASIGRKKYGKARFQKLAAMGRRKKLARGGQLTAAKAGTMLREGRAQGKALTDKQKRFFGWVRGGRKPRAR